MGNQDKIVLNQDGKDQKKKKNISHQKQWLGFGQCCNVNNPIVVSYGGNDKKFVHVI